MKIFNRIGFGIFLTALVACRTLAIEEASAAASCKLSDQFQQAVFKVLTKERALAQTGFSLKLLDRKSGDVLCEDNVQPDQNVYPASSIKTLVAVAVLRRVDQGAASLEDKITISQNNADDECSQWDCDDYGKGEEVTVRKLLWDMITISNNIATNQLVDLVTREYVNQTADELGASGLRFIRKVYDSHNPEPSITDRNHGNASGLAEVYREVATGRLGLLSQESRELLIEILKNQKINGSLNAQFPSSVKFYHKTGNTSDSTSDGGFFYVNDDQVAVLVGLQAFSKYKDCVSEDGCQTKTGFESLRKIGKAALSLVLPGVDQH